MNSITVKSSRKNYRILVGRGILRRAGDFFKAVGLTGKILVVTQGRVAKFHLTPVMRSLARKKLEVRVHRLPNGEAAKSEKELFRLFRSLVAHDFERGDSLLALGGGAVGDVAGFAAASYLRGVRYGIAGTTLLAQVDSSIGGKTAINLGAGKNLVGAFYPPRLVISDPGALSTLPDRELRASLAEVVKCGVIRDPKLFALLEREGSKVLAKNPRRLESLVLAAARIKARVVSRDEQEIRGERMILNFGHTFAHAFEQALGYRRLRHGEAVSIGMVCAARLAGRLKLFPNADCRRLERLLKNLKLPVSLAGLGLAASKILSAMKRDKKKKAGRLRFILPVRIGKVVAREGIPLGLVQKILLESGAK